MKDLKTEKGESLIRTAESLSNDALLAMCAISWSSTASVSFLLSISESPTDMKIAERQVLNEKATGFVLSRRYIFGDFIPSFPDCLFTNFSIHPPTLLLLLTWIKMEGMRTMPPSAVAPSVKGSASASNDGRDAAHATHAATQPKWVAKRIKGSFVLMIVLSFIVIYGPKSFLFAGQ